MLNAYSEECPRTIYISQTDCPEAPHLQNLFELAIPPGTKIIYTKVPRGLIVSIDEETFFNGESTDIKVGGVPVLNAVVNVLRQIDNECTIESHTEGHDYSNSLFEQDWELSNARASSIVNYLVYCGGVSSRRLFALGYGELMPFKGNVSGKDGIDKRVDFVIFDYEAKR